MTAPQVWRALQPVVIGLGLVASLLLLPMRSLESDLLLLASGGALSLAVRGGWDSWCVAAAAMATLAQGFVGSAYFPLGPALFFGLVFLPRALGARRLRGAVAIMALAAVGGALAELLASRYAMASGVTLLTALGVGAMFIASALWPAVDDVVASGLRRAARRSPAGLRRRLLRAVALRRRHGVTVAALSKSARRRVDRAWDELLVAARRRVESERSSHVMADKRIASYVDALQAATRAASISTDLSTEIDDAVLVALWTEQETLAASADALQEVQARH